MLGYRFLVWFLHKAFKVQSVALAKANIAKKGIPVKCMLEHAMSCTHSAKKGQSRASKARRLNALEDLTCLKDFTRFVKIHKDFKGSNSSCGASNAPFAIDLAEASQLLEANAALGTMALLASRLGKGGRMLGQFLSDKFWRVQVGSSWFKSVLVQEYSKTYSFMADRTECEGQ